MIRGLLFDLDGTLYDLAVLKRRLAVRVPREVLRHGLLGSWRRLQSLQWFRRLRERHRGSPREESIRDALVARVVEETGYPRDLVDEAVEDFLYDSAFRELRGLSPPGDLQVLGKLAARGYRLGVVSEYPVARKLVALGLGNVPWRAMVDCEEVGTLKPGPEVFLEAARRLGLPPGACLVIGDRKDADVAGAHRAGMRAAWLRGRDPGHGDGPEPEYVLEGLLDLLPLLPRLPAGAV